MDTKSNFELFPWESGKTWVVTTEFTIEWNGHKLTIPKGFQHDKYTFAPDVPDERPAVCHDRALEIKVWDDGSPSSIDDANKMLYDLMKSSQDKVTRELAGIYYMFLRYFWWFNTLKQKWFGKHAPAKSST